MRAVRVLVLLNTKQFLMKGFLLVCVVIDFLIHLEEGPGDVLVILTGQEEIEAAERVVQAQLRQLPEGSQKLLTVPIFSSLPSEHQMQAFRTATSGFRNCANLCFSLMIYIK